MEALDKLGLKPFAARAETVRGSGRTERARTRRCCFRPSTLDLRPSTFDPPPSPLALRPPPPAQNPRRRRFPPPPPKRGRPPHHLPQRGQAQRAHPQRDPLLFQLGGGPAVDHQFLEPVPERHH